MLERHAFPQILVFFKPYSGALIISTIISIVAVGAALVQPLAIQVLLEHVDNSDRAAIGGALVLLMVAMVAEATAIGVQTYLLYRVGASAVARVRWTLVTRILRWPLSLYANFGRGTLTTVTTADSAAMHALIVGGLFEIFTAAMLTVGALIFMYFISPPLTLITLGVVIVSILIVVISTNSVRRDSRLSQEHVASMSDQLGATLGAIRTLRSAGFVESREKAINHEIEESRRAMHRIGRRLSWVEPISNMAVQSSFISVLGFGGMMTYSGEISLAQLMAFLMYLMMTLTPIERGLSALPALQRNMGSWDRIRQLLDSHNSSKVKKMETRFSSSKDTGSVLSSVTVKASSLRCGEELLTASDSMDTRNSVSQADRMQRPPQIALRGVGYTLGNGWLFERVQAIFPSGSITAFWGPSGTGKSTMMDILAGLVEPVEGEVLVDGVNQELMGPSSYLEQRAPVIKGSIRDNLRLTAPNASDDEMLNVMGRLGLMHLVDRGGSGIDTHVGEDGLELSGGEGQRLAVARILLKPEPLILLDEPTSRVDVTTEQLIHQAIASLRGRHTIVIATHRESTRDLCDYVVEFRRRDTVGSSSVSPVHEQMNIRS